MSFDVAGYYVWASGGGAGSRLNYLDCQLIEEGGITGLLSPGVCQVQTHEPALWVYPQEIRIPEWFWSRWLYGRTQTLEIVQLSTGVCLRMYLSHILQLGTPSAEHGAVVVPLSAWSIIGPGGVVFQGGYLAELLAPPPRVLPVVAAEPTEVVDALRGTVPAIGSLAEALGGARTLVLHPKAWTDEYLEDLLQDLREHSGGAEIVLAREAWLASPQNWALWPSVVLGYPRHVVPIASRLEDRIGSATVNLLDQLRAAARTVLVWVVRDGTCHTLTGWVRRSKDMSTGWQITFS